MLSATVIIFSAIRRVAFTKRLLLGNILLFATMNLTYNPDFKEVGGGGGGRLGGASRERFAARRGDRRTTKVLPDRDLTKSHIP